MNTMAFLLAWVIAFILVGIGVAINVMLYRKGAFKSGPWERKPRLESVILSREAAEDERDAYMSLGINGGRPLDFFVRRVLKIFIGSIILVSVIIVVLIYGLPR